MRQFRKGPLVYSMKDLANGYSQDNRIWAMYNKQVFDLSDYFNTAAQMNNAQSYQFLPSVLTDVFQENPGTDVTAAIDGIPTSALSSSDKATAMNCMQNVFFRGSSDFRTTPRCTVPDYFLLAFSVVLIATIGIKFLAALQVTKKRNPELQDKFVICQVPCYTEGEESLKKTIDSLANLKYDDKRKLLFVICDGMIVGSGNDRPTPRIVLDILGVENLDPDPLLFKSLGVGNKQLNYVWLGAEGGRMRKLTIFNRARSTLDCMNSRDTSCHTSLWSKSASQASVLDQGIVASEILRFCSCDSSTAYTSTRKCPLWSSKSTTKSKMSSEWILSYTNFCLRSMLTPKSSRTPSTDLSQWQPMTNP